MFLAPAGLRIALHGRTPREGLGAGLVAGLAANLVGLSWTVGLLRDFASLPLAACLPLWALLAAAQSLGWACLGWAVPALGRRGVPPLLALPAGLVLAEWALPAVFPWTLAIGLHRVLPLVQIAEWTGTSGPTLLIGAVGVCAAEAVLRRSARTAVVGLGLVGVTAAVGWLRLAQVEKQARDLPMVRVGIVQPAVGIRQKHDPGRFRAILRDLQALTAELEAAGVDLVVWPESAYPYTLPVDARRDGESGLPRVRRRGRVPILFGALSRSRDRTRRYNSAFLLDGRGVLSEPVHKNELLLFGETVPFYRSLPALRRAFPRAEGFARGERPGVLALGPVRAGVLNCYEDILPAFGRALAQARPNVLVNLTNDAWFGDTAEPHLHNALASFRAIELRRDLVRAVNTGVSSLVDATGRIVAQTRPFERTTLRQTVRLREGLTLYARVGDVVPWLCLLALTVAWARGRRRPDRARPGP